MRHCFMSVLSICCLHSKLIYFSSNNTIWTLPVVQMALIITSPYSAFTVAEAGSQWEEETKTVGADHHKTKE